MFILSALDSSNALFWILRITVEWNWFRRRRKVPFIPFHPCFVQRHTPRSLPYQTSPRKIRPDVEIQIVDMILLVSLSLSFLFLPRPSPFDGIIHFPGIRAISME